MHKSNKYTPLIVSSLYTKYYQDLANNTKNKNLNMYLCKDNKIHIRLKQYNKKEKISGFEQKLTFLITFILQDEILSQTNLYLSQLKENKNNSSGIEWDDFITMFINNSANIKELDRLLKTCILNYKGLLILKRHLGGSNIEMEIKEKSLFITSSFSNLDKAAYNSLLNLLTLTGGTPCFVNESLFRNSMMVSNSSIEKFLYYFNLNSIYSYLFNEAIELEIKPLEPYSVDRKFYSRLKRKQLTIQNKKIKLSKNNLNTDILPIVDIDEKRKLSLKSLWKLS